MRTLASVLILLFAAGFADGGTLAEFKVELQKVRGEMNELIIDLLDDRRPLSEIAESEKQVREMLVKPAPNLQKVEFGGTIVEFDTRWFKSRFEMIDKNSDKRLEILEEIDERLAAIEYQIAELERSAATDRSKDEDRRKLQEILQRIEFQRPEQAEKSWLDRIREAIDRWLQEKFPDPQMPTGASEGLRTTSVILQVVLYAVIIGLVGFIIYKFAPFLLERFRKFEREDRSDRIILGERVAGHEDARSLFADAESLATAGDLRGAIRRGYIALLCELSDRRLIGLAHHKTNRDYLRDVHGNTELHREMRGMTNNFERHWYGFEDVRNEDWEEFRNQYHRAVEPK